MKIENNIDILYKMNKKKNYEESKIYLHFNWKN